MKDILDREIEVGDVLVYTSDYGGVKLTHGEVVSVEESSAKIRRITTSGWSPIKNGVRMKRVHSGEWPNRTLELVPTDKVPMLTRIGFPNRCFIVSKGGQ
jgi:hypothetical protein